jgi:hypothetical protein
MRPRIRDPKSPALLTPVQKGGRKCIMSGYFELLRRSVVTAAGDGSVVGSQVLSTP